MILKNSSKTKDILITIREEIQAGATSKDIYPLVLDAILSEREEMLSPEEFVHRGHFGSTDERNYFEEVMHINKEY